MVYGIGIKFEKRQELITDPHLKQFEVSNKCKPKGEITITKELWLNLPVKEISKSKEFFKEIGFSFNEERQTDEMAAMKVGEKQVPVMLIVENTFKNVIQHNVTDTKESSEIIISFDVESREEVDEIAKKVEEAGGMVFSKPAEIQGWMYGCAFTDLDGHRWNALYMDHAKAGQG